MGYSIRLLRIAVFFHITMYIVGLEKNKMSVFSNIVQPYSEINNLLTCCCLYWLQLWLIKVGIFCSLADTSPFPPLTHLLLLPLHHLFTSECYLTWFICQPPLSSFLLSASRSHLIPVSCCSVPTELCELLLVCVFERVGSLEKPKLSWAETSAHRCSSSCCLRDSCQSLFTLSFSFRVIPIVVADFFFFLKSYSSLAKHVFSGPKRCCAHREPPSSCFYSCCSWSVLNFFAFVAYVFCFCCYLWLTARTSFPWVQ